MLPRDVAKLLSKLIFANPRAVECVNNALEMYRMIRAVTGRDDIDALRRLLSRCSEEA